MPWEAAEARPTGAPVVGGPAAVVASAQNDVGTQGSCPGLPLLVMLLYT